MEASNIEILDMMGKKIVFETEQADNNINIILHTSASGNYFIHIPDPNKEGNYIVRRIVIQ